MLVENRIFWREPPSFSYPRHLSPAAAMLDFLAPTALAGDTHVWCDGPLSTEVDPTYICGGVNTADPGSYYVVNGEVQAPADAPTTGLLPVDSYYGDTHAYGSEWGAQDHNMHHYGHEHHYKADEGYDDEFSPHLAHDVHIDNTHHTNDGTRPRCPPHPRCPSRRPRCPPRAPLRAGPH